MSPGIFLQVRTSVCVCVSMCMRVCVRARICVCMNPCPYVQEYTPQYHLVNSVWPRMWGEASTNMCLSKPCYTFQHQWPKKQRRHLHHRLWKPHDSWNTCRDRAWPMATRWHCSVEFRVGSSSPDGAITIGTSGPFFKVFQKQLGCLMWKMKSKPIKRFFKCYLFRQKHSLQMFWEVPFIELQNDT